MMAHLPILPIVLPLLAAGLALLVERRGIALQRVIAFVSIAAQLACAGWLLVLADRGEVIVHLVGNWEAEIGIALAVDRLAAIMLASTACLGLAGLLYGSTGWDRRAPHFHALYQILLMGLNGAFLTADLFNLFVFFEVLLIASYGLMLSGGRSRRMRAGLHYVAFNITASTLYLVAIGLLYGLLGALNMAEMAVRIAAAPAENLALIKAAGGLLLLVFCAKAALFPLHLWLPETYTRTPAPALMLFAVMTKLGVYAVLRVYTLLFGSDAGELAGFAWDWLLPAAGIGLLLASLGALAARTLRSLTGYLVIGSAATLFLAGSLDSIGTLGAGLYYLPQSAFATAAMFLLADLVRRQRQRAGDRLDLIDRLPAKAMLGTLFFVTSIVLVGLPPLAGFIGKLALMAAVSPQATGWVWPLLLVSSLLMLIALAQAGSQLFWRSTDGDDDAALPRPVEYAAVLWLLGLVIAWSIAAGPALRYAEDAARQLLAPAGYRDALLHAAPIPSEAH